MIKVIKNQSCLTLEEIKHAAMCGTRAAIRCSARHWYELAATPADIIGNSGFGARPSQVNMGRSGCALCLRFRSGDDYGCLDCPLNKVGHCCYGKDSLYGRALLYKYSVAHASNKRERDAAVKRFRRVAEKLAKLLEKLYVTYEATGA